MNETIAGGLRLPKTLWQDLEKLALSERRRLNQYIAIVLEDHVNEKKENEKSIKKQKH